MLAEDVAGILNVLAERFGTTVEHLWSVMVLQARVEAIQVIIALLTFLAVGMFVIRWIFAHDFEDGEEESVARGLRVTAYLVVGFLLFLAVIERGVTGLVNPEYWALEQVLKLLSGG